MKNFLLLTFSLVVLSAFQLKATPKKTTGFTENKGQWPEEVLFLYKQNQMNAWITTTGVVYDFRKVSSASASMVMNKLKGVDYGPDYTIGGHVVKMTLLDGLIPSSTRKAQPAGHKENFFLGNDESRWATNVETFEEVVLKNVYAGIDLRYYKEGEHMRYDFIVHPGANPSQIRWDVDGVKCSIVDNGTMVMHTSIGDVQQSGLKAYQTIGGAEKLVDSHFSLNDGKVSFGLGAFDASATLIIDPILLMVEWGDVNDYEEFFRIQVDAAGTRWVYGESQGAGYPTTVGAYSNTSGGDIDFVITRIDAAGTGFIFSTYLGGNGEEELFPGNTTAFTSDGGMVLTGTTQSSNFPTVVGAFDNTYNGERDAVVFKINGAGTSLGFSTYFGGPANDYGGAVTVDAQNNVYLAGWTAGEAGSYPITGGVYDQTANGGGDIGVTKFNSTCSSVSFSTLFGGNDYDDLYGIGLDASGNITGLGYTRSTDLPASSGFQSSLAGNNDLLVFKLNTTGSSLVACTYLGGSGDDQGFGFDINTDGNVVFSGHSLSTDFPIVNGFPTAAAGWNAVVGTLSSNLSSLLFSTYYGGNGDDRCFSLATDANNSIYITGYTNSTNLFLINPDQNTFGGGNWDSYMVRYEADTNWILYSSYYGGNGDDIGSSIWCNDAGVAYVAGLTGSTNLPLGAQNLGDGIITSVDGLLYGVDVCHSDFSSASVVSPLCVNSTVELMADGGQTYGWTGPNGYSSNQQNPTFTATSQSAGTYTVTVTDYGCTSSSQVTLAVNPALGTSIIGSANVDPLTATSYIVSQTLGSTYIWTVTGGSIISGQGTNNVSITFPNVGQATVSVTETNGNCSETVSLTVNVGCTSTPTSPTITGAIAATPNSSQTYSVQAQAGYSYDWTVTGGNIVSGASTNAISVQWGNPGVGTVSVIIADGNGCAADPTTINVTIQNGTPVPQWVTIATDPSNDGVQPQLMDGTLLEYRFDSQTDSLWFRATVAAMSEVNTQEVGMNVHLLYSGGTQTFDFWGDDNNGTTNALGWHRMLTTWVTGTPPSSYSGTIGVADAAGVNGSSYTNLSSNNINVRVDQSAKTITLGLLRGAAQPASAMSGAITVAAAVGSNIAWNDDIYLPGATINLGPAGTDDVTGNGIRLMAYPNPNNGQFRIDLQNSGFTVNAEVTIVDNTGRTVYRASAKSLQPTIELGTVAGGIYLLRVSEGNSTGTARISVLK